MRTPTPTPTPPGRKNRKDMNFVALQGGGVGSTKVDKHGETTGETVKHVFLHKSVVTS